MIRRREEKEKNREKKEEEFSKPTSASSRSGKSQASASQRQAAEILRTLADMDLVQLINHSAFASVAEGVGISCAFCKSKNRTW